MISVLYEDENYLILHKPSGTPSVPLSAEETATAVHAALSHADLRGIGSRKLEPGLLHRLDTGTSGILVFAKNQATFDFLKAHWKTPLIRKWYRAAVKAPDDRPSPAPQVGQTIETPLGRSAKSSKRMIPIRQSGDLRKIRGKPLTAHTQIQGLKPLPAKRLDLTLEITTGVMHQIRCHLSSIGWPIEGDPIYKGESSARLMLHAWRIEIPLHPAAGTTSPDSPRLLIEAQLPSEWPKEPRA